MSQIRKPDNCNTQLTIGSCCAVDKHSPTYSLNAASSYNNIWHWLKDMPENYRRRIERLERSSAFRPGNAEVKPREKKRQNLRGVNHGNSNADRTRATTKLPLLSRGGTPQLKPWLKKRGKKAADKGGQGSRGAGFASHSRRNAVPG